MDTDRIKNALNYGLKFTKRWAFADTPDAFAFEGQMEDCGFFMVIQLYHADEPLAGEVFEVHAGKILEERRGWNWDYQYYREAGTEECLIPSSPFKLEHYRAAVALAAATWKEIPAETLENFTWVPWSKTP